ncbi:MAG: DUF262 domain-containing protein [Phascolarctobacterium sp.]|nr:DUF262 domain-containing protein [Phascolarctobacterium sp.]
MQGESTKLEWYMSAASSRFDIPVYQRNYDWREANCKHLYDDLVKIIKLNRKSHFFGSFISVLDHFGPEVEFLVIDGQQRLTTISILCVAMYNLLTHYKVFCEDQEYLAKEIWVKFLIDEEVHHRPEIKMRNIKEDQEAYLKLFTDDPEQFVKDSRITQNYLYFYNRILEKEIPIDKLYEAITRLEIIKLTLDVDDDPQLVFESLNSTGLALEDADKIRNFVFMGLTRERQAYFFHNYWNPIQKASNYEVTSLIYSYLKLHYKPDINFKNVYFEFKDFMEDKKISTEELLKNILAYANLYGHILHGTTSDTDLNDSFIRLHKLSARGVRSYFLKLLRLQEEGIFSLKMVKNIVLTLEHHTLKRVICDIPASSLEKTYQQLLKELLAFKGTEEEYFQSFLEVLYKGDALLFPQEKPIYHSLDELIIRNPILFDDANI